MSSAEALRAADQVTDAIQELKRALELEGALQPRLVAEARVRLADCHRELNEHEESYAAIGPLLDSPPDQIWRARALVRLARVLYFRGDSEATHAACTEAIEILNPTSHHEDLGLAHLWNGHANKVLGETEAADGAYQAGLACARRVSATVLEGACLNSLGHLRMLRADLPAAQLSFERALRLDEQSGHRPDMAKVRLHLATCQFKRARWEEARATLDSARTTYRELNDDRGLAMVELLEARLSRSRGEDPSEHLARAEAHAEAASYQRVTFQLVEERGFHAVQTHDYRDAVAHFEKVLSAFESIGADVKYDSRRGLAIALLRLGKTSEARREAQLGLQEAVAAGDKLAECLSKLVLAEVQQSLAQARSALESVMALDAPAARADAHRLVAGLAKGAERDHHATRAALIETEFGIAEKTETHTPPAPSIEAASPEMRRLLADAMSVTDFTGPIVLEGEPSVGKRDLAARIHQASERGSQPLAVVSCEDMWESDLREQLFGRRTRPGAFLAVGSGTLVLSCIDRAPMEVLADVGRAIQRMEISPVDAEAPLHHSATLICTSTTPLHALARDGVLDQRSYNVLSRMTLLVPPLRRRPEDVQTFANHFAQRKPSARVMKALVAYDWPGNIDELRNTIDAAQHRAGGQSIGVEHLPERFRTETAHGLSLQERIEALERETIGEALRRTKGNKQAAAKILGVSRKGLIDRLKRLGLWESFRRRQTRE